MSEDAVVLFRDTAVEDAGSGVKKFFAELAARTRHSDSIVVTASEASGIVPRALVPLFAASPDQAHRNWETYASLAAALTARSRPVDQTTSEGSQEGPGSARDRP